MPAARQAQTIATKSRIIMWLYVVASSIAKAPRLHFAHEVANSLGRFMPLDCRN